MVHSFNKIRQGGDSEESQCIVCSDEPPSVKFEPCGHVIACKGWYACAELKRLCQFFLSLDSF